MGGSNAEPEGVQPSTVSAITITEYESVAELAAKHSNLGEYLNQIERELTARTKERDEARQTCAELVTDGNAITLARNLAATEARELQLLKILSACQQFMGDLSVSPKGKSPATMLLEQQIEDALSLTPPPLIDVLRKVKEALERYEAWWDNKSCSCGQCFRCGGSAALASLKPYTK